MIVTTDQQGNIVLEVFLALALMIVDRRVIVSEVGCASPWFCDAQFAAFCSRTRRETLAPAFVATLEARRIL